MLEIKVKDKEGKNWIMISSHVQTDTIPPLWWFLLTDEEGKMTVRNHMELEIDHKANMQSLLEQLPPIPVQFMEKIKQGRH